ncbi:hypothetical protein B7C42_03128 [Nocardia cerradoensis]|uniref:Uncharacterized protein n=1 Tax=Nocardia cerradoensis TaxID=85688 RepID=A0A231H8M8_9NOCA|nr:hypothetical protein B7C42_03128 [Nocardia cerradoensis]
MPVWPPGGWLRMPPTGATAGFGHSARPVACPTCSRCRSGKPWLISTADAASTPSLPGRPHTCGTGSRPGWASAVNVNTTGPGPPSPTSVTSPPDTHEPCWPADPSTIPPISPTTCAFTQLRSTGNRSWQSPAPGGRSRNASKPPRTNAASTTTKSANGIPGTGTSPWPCSPMPSSPSPPPPTQKPRGLGRLTVADVRRLLAIVLHPARTLAHALAACHWRRRHQAHA